MKKKSERKKHFFKIVIVASGFALLDAETLFGRVLASKLIQGKMTDDSKILRPITSDAALILVHLHIQPPMEGRVLKELLYRNSGQARSKRKRCPVIYKTKKAAT